MRNNINAVFETNGCSNGYCPRTFTDNLFFEKTIGVGFVNDLFLMIGYIDIGGTKSNQRFYGLINGIDIISFQGGKQFYRKKGMLGVLDMVCYFHAI